LDKVGRYYAWVLLFLTLLPAVLRLLKPVEIAELVGAKMQDLKKRARARLLGIGSVAGSFVLLPVYLLYSRRGWLIIAFMVGVLTGIEMIGNAARPEPSSLVRQNRIFGWVYALTAAGIFVWLVRK
jgi:hypothetical protein